MQVSLTRLAKVGNSYTAILRQHTQLI